ncbi:MAG: hypothetical protein K0U29_05385 [Gammaproteobacteria bacterium]|nr:hypothetical protein [Gammaproteobacteria bacterium]MCH9744350.1 hypothetical protein [Gammaproteobacteria bacterium]
MKNYSTTLQRLLITLCCLIGLGLMVNAQATPKAKKKVSALLVLSAKKGVLQKSAKGRTLTLTDIDPHVLWFTDRPNRKAGFVPTQKFIASWAKSFKGDPPNAGLVHADMSYTRGGNQAPLAIELKNAKMKNGVMTFDVTNINQYQGKSTMLYNRVVLFIDNVGMSRISLRGIAEGGEAPTTGGPW